MKTAPANPAQLRAALVDLFPDFEQEIDEDTSLGREITFHTLMFDFAPFYGKNRQGFSDGQMQGLAKLLNLAIGASGALENAVATCFLEGTRRDRTLRAALARTRG